MNIVNQFFTHFYKVENFHNMIKKRSSPNLRISWMWSLEWLYNSRASVSNYVWFSSLLPCLLSWRKFGAHLANSLYRKAHTSAVLLVCFCFSAASAISLFMALLEIFYIFRRYFSAIYSKQIISRAHHSGVFRYFYAPNRPFSIRNLTQPCILCAENKFLCLFTHGSAKKIYSAEGANCPAFDVQTSA